MERFEEGLVAALKDAVRGLGWQRAGPAGRLAAQRCTKLYSEDGEHIVLVCTEDGTFYAMDSACPHEGGPLELGDIEDLGSGKLALICPWHHFDFCLDTGESSTGLKNQVYEVTVVDGNVYIKTENMLSISDTGQREDVCKGAVGCGEDTSGQGDDSLCYWAVKILSTPDPEEKVQLTLEVQRRWEAGELEAVGCWIPPDQPPRAADLAVLEPGRIKRGKGGTLGSRIALLHSLANIEQWAIDLSWDIIARFSDVRTADETPLPRQFFNDFVKVAGDEAKHFKLLETRIRALGSHFGALPVHNGLWQSARETSRDLRARLAVVHMVHEARRGHGSRHRETRSRCSFWIPCTRTRSRMSPLACGGSPTSARQQARAACLHSISWCDRISTGTSSLRLTLRDGILQAWALSGISLW
ncbi:uncharacterized protein LOC133343838 isoform X3 [Lethenteron reissneri]|uniref:uncharacterized protein LOC133343838 isoform X3 n=1 Tax=Lethenteron reissneri TaxID=7753 RepID=UPI002AB68BA3|nr:uncharacterized protein LOC133343838 isoform X3 [Lethenteron reissneri]